MARSTITKLKNNTSEILEAGRAVYISGFDDTDATSTIEYASNSDESKMPAIGITASNISSGQIGSVKTNGVVAGIDTTGLQPSDEVFIGENGNIIFEDPANSNSSLITQQIGIVTRVGDILSGQIFVIALGIRAKTKSPINFKNKVN